MIDKRTEAGTINSRPEQFADFDPQLVAACTTYSWRTNMDGLIEQAKRAASELRVSERLLVRVVERNCRVIWSKVDDGNADLTKDNSEGVLLHLHSLFVPHGAESPLDELKALKAENARLQRLLELRR